MSSALVLEFAVSDWRDSKIFYCHILGFKCIYERAKEGFCYLKLGEAELMIDQIGKGRTFDEGHQPTGYPYGKGLNVQILVPSVAPLLDSLSQHEIGLYLPVEDRWYRVEAEESGNRQFIVADPDDYLLRFYQHLGKRKIKNPGFIFPLCSASITLIYHNIRSAHRENALSAILRRNGQKTGLSLPETPQNAPDDSDAPA